MKRCGLVNMVKQIIIAIVEEDIEGEPFLGDICFNSSFKAHFVVHSFKTLKKQH